MTLTRRPLAVKRRNTGFSNVGMEKSGTQSIGSSWTQITGWTTKAGWGGPSGNSLVASASKVVLLDGVVDLGTGYQNKGVRVKRNSEIVFEFPQAFTSDPIPFRLHCNAVAGDVFTIEAICNVTVSAMPTTTYMTMKEQVFALTTTFSDDFNRADGDIDAAAGWDDMSSLAKPKISSNRVIGTGDNNCRAVYEVAPSAGRNWQFYKIDVAGINSRAGLIYNASTGSDSSWAVLSNSTTLLLGATSSTTSSAAGTTQATVTVPTVTPPKEMLVLLTTDNSADIFLDRVYVATHRIPTGYGACGGLYTLSATDIVDNYSQGTWA